ncbi:MAG: cell envelope integrity protein TolA [Clostridia bacterium]|nr:cell envelope integrity protein TolA [Clostridia bacterium]
MVFLGIIIFIIFGIIGVIQADREEQEIKEMKRRHEEERKKAAAESAAYWEKRRLEEKERAKQLAEQLAKQQASKSSPSATHLSSNSCFNYSFSSPNMGYNNTYPVKRYETVEEINKRCDEYWERHLGMPISSITNTPDYSAFGIAANTPGVDLAEAQMFDNLDLF